jgi:hypothetical protein
MDRHYHGTDFVLVDEPADFGELSGIRVGSVTDTAPDAASPFLLKAPRVRRREHPPGFNTDQASRRLFLASGAHDK